MLHREYLRKDMNGLHISTAKRGMQAYCRKVFTAQVTTLTTITFVMSEPQAPHCDGTLPTTPDNPRMVSWLIACSSCRRAMTCPGRGGASGELGYRSMRQHLICT